MAYDIKDMQEIARLYGGKCLGKEYIDQYSPLKWMCEKGHTWDAPYTIIQQGGWCVQCSRTAKTKKSLDQIKEIARFYGGKCLSNEYINNRSPLSWMCQKGHTWAATYSLVKRGFWCIKCANQEKFNQMKLYAKERKGKLLSLSYKGYGNKYKWQCDKRHIWHQTFEGLKLSWCWKCKKEKNRLLYMQALKKFVQDKGGQVLSNTFSDSQSHISFKCQNGHNWKSTSNSIFAGKWCPACAGNIKPPLERYKNIAKERGGKCLSSIYINSNSPLQFQCAQKHIWNAKPASILSGSWCPMCTHKADTKSILKEKIAQIKTAFIAAQKKNKKNAPAYNQVEKIKMMQAIALLHKGKCLSKKYISNRSKLKWQCLKGHSWQASPASIIQSNWCPFCGGTAKGTIQEMNAIAEKKKGKCLSAEYINADTKLQWQCANGHIWEATPLSIKRGSWCRSCAGMPVITLQNLRNLAKARGGKCLAKHYKNGQTKIKWQCAYKHIWEATYSSVSSGSWCPECARKRMAETRKKRLLEFSPSSGVSRMKE